MGIRESEIEFCKDMFKDSITIFGNTNISMQRKLNKVIDHNNVENFDMIDDFFNAEMLNIVSKEPNAKFMYYSQINSYDSIKRIGLLKNVICLNNQDLVNYISDKFKLKQDYKNIVPILVPLFINSFRRADELAIAMESRCYQGSENRFKFRVLKFTRNDFISFIVFISLIVLTSFI